MNAVRASAAESGTAKDEHRWFHMACFRQDPRGWPHAIDFPQEAKSDQTICTGCKLPINARPKELN